MARLGTHLHSKAHGVATSSIVGASLPLGAGFALAASRLLTVTIAVAQRGEGALDQGIALETLNLAVAWQLPLLVVCIDNGWVISTRAGTVTAGDLTERARAFGWDVARANGKEVEAGHAATGTAIERVRSSRAPSFLCATCQRLEGHYLGDRLVAPARAPLSDRRVLGSIVRGASASGPGPGARAESLRRIAGTLSGVRRSGSQESPGGPLQVARRRLTRRGLSADAIDAEGAARGSLRRPTRARGSDQ